MSDQLSKISNKVNKILVVVAHPDDEILGVGGIILKHVKTGDEVSILVLGDGESSKDSGADIAKREKQAQAVAKALGVREIILKKFPDNQFDSVPLLEITKEVERTVAKVKPDIVYTHFAYDLNVDHRLTFQAVLTACRPQPDFGVKKILAFETPSSTEWQFKDQANMFAPTEYHDISGFIEQKIEVLKIYRDELRAYPHPRSVEGIRILAQYRGLEVGYKYAEAFQVIRILND